MGSEGTAGKGHSLSKGEAIPKSSGIHVPNEPFQETFTTLGLLDF